MSQLSRTSIVVVALALVVLTISVAPVFAIGTSVSNPGMPVFKHEDGEWQVDWRSDSVPWRFGWGRRLDPHFEFDNDGFAGIAYLVDRDPNTTMLPSSVDNWQLIYDHTSWKQGTLFEDNIIDIQGVYVNEVPEGGWNYSIPGMSDDREGIWYFHSYKYENTTVPYDFSPRYQVDTHIKIDITRPSRVPTVNVSPGLASMPATECVTAGSRARVYWAHKDLDRLSGTAFYSVWLDGGEDPAYTVIEDPNYLLVPNSEDSTQSPLWYNPALAGRTQVITVEDLAPGRHTVQLMNTDRATNTSTLSAAAIIWADPDTPTVSITRPYANQRYRNWAVFSAVASDSCVPAVSFYVDGSYVGRDLTEPFSLPLELTPYSQGRHTLRVDSTDKAGRKVSAYRYFYVDRTAPFITWYSDLPDPFYPRLVDGYKDRSIIRFRTSEYSTVSLLVYNSKGKLVKTITGKKNAGTNSIAWNGKWNDGVVRTGTYRYRLRATDSAGNSRVMGLSYPTTIRFYEVVRVAGNAAKVIPR